MKPRTLTPQQQLILISLAVLLGLGAYITYGILPLFQWITGLRQEAETINQQLQRMQQTLLQEGRLRDELTKTEKTLEQLRSAFPSEDRLPSVIEVLSDVATQSGVKIQTISPEHPTTPPPAPPAPPAGGKSPGKTKGPVVKPLELYKEIPIQIDALAGFHQIGMFLSRVESGAQPMQVRLLRISENPAEPRRHIVKLQLVAYFASLLSADNPSSSPATANTASKRGKGN